jgi:translation initiation factor 2B subunit (eIF-2B alpha/beta/delta family)
MARGRSGGIRIPIITEFDDKAIKNFASSIEGLGKSLSKGLTVPILAVGGALSLMVKGAIEAEAVQNRLRQILLTTGGATEQQVKLLLDQAAALEKVGVVSKENVIATQSQLATFDLQAGTIAKLTPAILDYVTAEKGARASTEDFKSLTNSLAQALNGQFGGLTRVGFVLDDHTKKLISSGTEAERAAAIVSVLNSTYEGFNETLANTPEGQLIKLEQEFRNLKDEVGKALIPVMGDLVAMIRSDIVPIVEKAAFAIKTLAERFTALDDKTKKQIVAVILLAAAIGPLLVVVASLIKGVLVLAGAFVLLTKAVFLIPLAVLAIIGVFRAQSDAQYQLAKETGDTWLQIGIVIEKAINFVLKVIENFINGLMVLELGFDHLGRKADNFFNILAGKPADSLVTFRERVRNLAKYEFKNFASGTDGMGQSIANFANSFSSIMTELKGFEAQQDFVAKSADNLERELEAIEKQLKNMGNETGNTGEKTKKLKDAMKALRQEIVKIKTEAVNALKSSLAAAQRNLEDARQKFNQFKDAIKGAITSVLNFQKAGEGADFLGGLTRQAEKAKGFADRIKKLIKMGLSKTALQQIIDAGADAGSIIADQIIAGGADMVKQTNKLVSSIEKIAEETGQAGAVKFYNQGIIMGESIVAGILAALEAAQAALEAAIQGNFPKANKANKKAPKKGGKKGKRENGGPVTGGQTYLVGERGPELFSPFTSGSIISNDRSRKISSGGGGGVTININAGNVVGSKEELLSFIQRGLREYDRRNGKLNINA